jgi:hypothetical protein
LSYCRPSTPPVPPSPAFKKPIRPCIQAHTTHRYLPDNTAPAPVPDRALHHRRGAPRAPPIPGESGAPRTCRWSRAAEKELRRCSTPSLLLPVTSGEPPGLRPLPGPALSPSPLSWGRRPRAIESCSNPTAERSPYLFGFKCPDRRAPPVSTFFLPALGNARWAGP